MNLLTHVYSILSNVGLPVAFCQQFFLHE